MEDIAASDEFSVDVQLRVGRPVAIELHFLSNNRVVQNVD